MLALFPAFRNWTSAQLTEPTISKAFICLFDEVDGSIISKLRGGEVGRQSD